MKRLSKFLFPALMSFILLLSAFVIVASLVAAAAPNPNAQTLAASNPNEGELVARGRALFLAKGCLVCHRNDDLAAVRREMGDFDFGDVPNLSNVKIDAAYLKRWLHDPQAVKPSTTMPNLNLSDREIDALAAYLTRDQ